MGKERKTLRLSPSTKFLYTHSYHYVYYVLELPVYSQGMKTSMVFYHMFLLKELSF